MTDFIQRFNLAGIRVRLECQPEAFATAVQTRYRTFLAADDPEEPADFTARVIFSGPQVIVSELDLRMQVIGAEYHLDSVGATGIISLVNRCAELTLSNTAPLASMEYFLRTLFALLVVERDGLMLHCAGALADSGVHLFVGHSGGGKSTASALSADHAVILNDDLVILLPEAGRWIAHGTPFWNFETLQRAGQTTHGPIVGIYTLVKDPGVYLAPMSPAAAVAELYTNCPVVNADPGRAPELLARCQQLTLAIPMQKLHFRKAPSFWDVLEPNKRPMLKDGG